MRTGDALRIEPMRDCARGFAGGKLGEDTAHDGGLDLVDLATASDRLASGIMLPDNVVTETESATGPSVAHPAFKAAANLLSEVFQEERIHRALEADMQLTDLAFGQSEEPHSGEAQALIVRGPQHNGRRTVLGAIARMLDRGLLEIRGLGKADDERWRLIGPLATLLHALPAIVLDLAPGETAELPHLNGYDGPSSIVLGKQGGLSGPGAERVLSLTLEIPDVDARRLQWQRSFGSHAVGELDSISER